MPIDLMPKNRSSRSARLLAAALACLCFASPLAAEPAGREAVTADPKANAQARAILGYIQGLPDRADKRVLSGQWAGYGPMATPEQLEAISKQTGHWPAYIGVDYTDWNTHGLSTAKANQIATAYWREGGLVEIDIVFATSPNGGELNDRDVNLIDCITPGTAANARWQQDLDTMAAGLQELQQAGVVVLWRPLHEMNGNWFWWGGKPVPDFVRLWRHMFDYFTVTKGLHNLLWVYSANIEGVNTRAGIAGYYPGDGYVDLVGFDAYGDHIDPDHFKGYPALVALGKPFFFCEYGPHGPSKAPGTADISNLIKSIREHFPRTAGFMCWNENWSPANNRNCAEFYNDPWIVNREDLPAELAGRQAGAAGGDGRDDAQPDTSAGKTPSPGNAASGP
ncbi:MAG: glycosyl hydrolase [Opitutaceae bacterium]|nr:glycosyl hydrolase [Opitutaceae bacterium]